MGEQDGRRPLRARELEIARLIAGGLSTRAVAERLVLSERTVENHLHRAYRAFGITGRAELPGALARRDEHDDRHERQGEPDGG